ncbi:hypothetical protein MTO96_005901 [Rhipicephalus appendiculatus]
MSSIKQLAKYNIKWGLSNKSNHSSFMNQSDMRAKYRKKFRAILQKNKILAKALVEARTKISDLESAQSRQQKIDNLALPQIKMWLETNLQFMHTMAKQPLARHQAFTGHNDTRAGHLSHRHLRRGLVVFSGSEAIPASTRQTGLRRIWERHGDSRRK